MLKVFKMRSSFTKLFYSLIILLSIILLTCSLVFYDNYEKQTIRQASDSSKQILTQTALAVDFVWDLSSNHLYDLYGDADVYNSIYSRDVSPTEAINASIKITKAISNSMFLESVYLYNGNMQKVFSTKGSTSSTVEFYDKDILKLLKNENEMKTLHFIPRKVKYNINGVEINDNLLTLISSEAPDKNGNLEGALIINVKEGYIRNILKSLIPFSDDVTMLVDEKGRVISDYDPDMFLKDLSSEEYIKSIVASKDNSGQFTGEVNGEKSLVTFISSSKLKWKIIQVTPYGKLVAKAYNMRNLIIIFCIILFTIGAIISYFISRKFYLPIRKLVNKANDISTGTIAIKGSEKHELEYVSDFILNMKDELLKAKYQSLDDSRLIRNELLKELLLGGYIHRADLEGRFNNLEFDFQNVVVYVLKIDNYYNEEIFNYSVEDLSLYRFAIGNIAQELTEQFYSNETVDMGEDTIAVIVKTKGEPDSTIEADLKTVIKQIQDAVQKYLNFSLSGSIGPLQKHIKNINKSYNNAVLNSNYRLIYGKRSVITQEILNLKEVAKYHYSQDIFMPVLNNLKLRKYDLVEKQVDKFFGRLAQMEYDDIMVILSQIIHDSIATINLMNHCNNSGNAYSFKVLRDQVERFDTLEEIKEWLLYIYKNEIEYIEDNPKDTKREYINMVFTIIHNEYNDPGLNIESIAERVGLSVNYLRAIFKEALGISLTDYISKYRYEKALELLVNSNLTVAAISEMIGMNSENHFYTFFKKFNGLTPTQFRKKEQN
ncbi:AraC family transcriptional regulator [Ruminiclostridium cellobioparum]|jgi:two-component system response regulator YesN|uniref:AraC family transcriptional regulator n=1 Tax=Ruminiclostridium cellobioparum TaxID=29355 RepID=UPI0004804CD5|nr:AraC family transcriptional regulator [Ruminiclostridium cellobioparum]